MDAFLHQYFDLDLMWRSLPEVLGGFWLTIQLWLVASVLALVWGLALSLLRQLPGRAAAPIRAVTIVYIDALRGVPLLLTVVLVSGGLGALASEDVIADWIGLPRWFGMPDPFWYGVFAITLTYGAYMAEVYRSGIEAVPGGQMQAARSLGMSYPQAMRGVVVPQAIRKVFAPLLNDLIALMKDTSLVLVIGLAEVVSIGQDIQGETLNSSALTLGAVLFLIVTIPLARIVDRQIVKQQIRYQRV